MIIVLIKYLSVLLRDIRRSWLNGRVAIKHIGSSLEELVGIY